MILSTLSSWNSGEMVAIKTVTTIVSTVCFSSLSPLKLFLILAKMSFSFFDIFEFHNGSESSRG